MTRSAEERDEPLSRLIGTGPAVVGSQTQPVRVESGNTVAGALAFLDELGDPRIKLHVDTYHMNIEESDLFSPVLAAGDRLGYVHIGESHRGYLGSGIADFDAFFRARPDRV